MPTSFESLPETQKKTGLNKSRFHFGWSEYRLFIQLLVEIEYSSIFR